MDPYVYPGTNVLRNLRDIRDPERLNKAEGIATARRIAELQSNPQPGKFDGAHLQSIHRYIFQDIYAWAGEFRTVNISRSGQFPFAFPEHIVPSITTLCVELAKECDPGGGVSLPKFANCAAHYLGELNAIHPFRDGNGRTQREFIRQHALRSGFALDWSRVSREQMTQASKRSFQQGDNSGLEQVLRSALSVDRTRHRA